MLPCGQARPGHADRWEAPVRRGGGRPRTRQGAREPRDSRTPEEGPPAGDRAGWTPLGPGLPDYPLGTSKSPFFPKIGENGQNPRFPGIPG